MAFWWVEIGLEGILQEKSSKDAHFIPAESHVGNGYNEDIHRSRGVDIFHRLCRSIFKEDKGVPRLEDVETKSSESELRPHGPRSGSASFRLSRYIVMQCVPKSFFHWHLNVSGLIIRSENGSQLTSHNYEKHLKTLGIKHETIHAHTPEWDGLIESCFGGF